MDDTKLILNLEKSIAFLENRISLVDNKCTVLIAAITLYTGFLVFLFDSFLPNNFNYNLKGVVTTCNIITIGFFLFIFLSLIRTLRPTKGFLTLRSSSNEFRSIDKKGLYSWYTSKFPKDFKSYVKQMNKLDDTDIKNNTLKTHYILLKQVRNKYSYYRYAVHFIKIMILFNIASICLFIIMSFIK